MREMVNNLSAELTPLFSSYIPNLVGAMMILLVGWVLALVASALIRSGLRRTGLDTRLAKLVKPGEVTEGTEVQNWIGKGVYYLIMLFVLLAVFQTLHLTQVTEPLNRLLSKVFEFAPQVISAAVLLGLAWILATVLRFAIVRGLNAAQLDRRLGSQADIKIDEQSSMSQSIGDVVYWFIFLLFLPAVLSTLELDGLLGPVNSMMSTLLGFFPNLVAAGVILVVGWFLARIVQRIITSLLGAAGADRLSEQVGLNQVLGTRTLSGAIGLIVYVLILIPVMIGALNALSLDAITQPASDMLALMLGKFPNLVGAGLVLIIAYAVGRMVATIVTNLLSGIGFNTILARVGVPTDMQSGAQQPATIVGTLILVTIMLFAFMEASEQLGFILLADLISKFTFFVGHLFLGLIIFAIGLYLANLASQTIRTSQTSQATIVGRVAYLAIMILGTAMALREMGLAEEIVNLAFGLILGALAIAFAIALGLGGA